MRTDLTKSPVLGVHQKDSRENVQIQLCDLLLGAVTDTWNAKSSNPGKTAIKNRIARHLGWSDLKADTWPSAVKFNIWYFHSENGEAEIDPRDTPWEYPKRYAKRAARMMP